MKSTNRPPPVAKVFDKLRRRAQARKEETGKIIEVPMDRLARIGKPRKDPRQTAQRLMQKLTKQADS